MGVRSMARRPALARRLRTNGSAFPWSLQLRFLRSAGNTFAYRLEHGLDQFHDAALHVGIVGNGSGNRHVAGPLDCNTLADERPGVNKESRTHAFLEAVIL